MVRLLDYTKSRACFKSGLSTIHERLGHEVDKQLQQKLLESFTTFKITIGELKALFRLDCDLIGPKNPIVIGEVDLKRVKNFLRLQHYSIVTHVFYCVQS